MRKLFTRLCCVLFVVAPLFAEVASASDQTKDDDRLRNSGTVLGEILEILSYSRARVLFAGVSLEGSTIRPDNSDNQRVYGKKIPARDIVLSGKVPRAPDG